MSTCRIYISVDKNLDHIISNKNKNVGYNKEVTNCDCRDLLICRKKNTQICISCISGSVCLYPMKFYDKGLQSSIWNVSAICTEKNINQELRETILNVEECVINRRRKTAQIEIRNSVLFYLNN